MDGWRNEWTNEWMNKWRMNEWINEWRKEEQEEGKDNSSTHKNIHAKQACSHHLEKKKLTEATRTQTTQFQHFFLKSKSANLHLANQKTKSETRAPVIEWKDQFRRLKAENYRKESPTSPVGHGNQYLYSENIPNPINYTDLEKRWKGDWKKGQRRERVGTHVRDTNTDVTGVGGARGGGG
jgi:methyltransferase-like protein